MRINDVLRGKPERLAFEGAWHEGKHRSSAAEVLVEQGDEG